MIDIQYLNDLMKELADSSTVPGTEFLSLRTFVERLEAELEFLKNTRAPVEKIRAVFMLYSHTVMLLNNEIESPSK
jgi:hypothetical protein